MRTTAFFLCIGWALAAASVGARDLVKGQIYAVKLTNVDGRPLSTADGHITILVLAARKDVDKARLIGDRTPERCLGNPNFRMITVLHFPNGTSRPGRFLYTALIRQRVDAEARKLKPRYLAKKLAADPRRDVHVVADFDGRTASQFGIDPDQFRVLILGPDGALLREWSEMPSAEQLARALPEAPVTNTASSPGRSPPPTH